MIVRPSKLFHEIFSGSESVAGSSPPSSLSVQRSIFPVGPAVTSTEYTSEADRAEASEKARSFPFAWKRTAPIVPSGIFGSAISFLVAVSRTCSVSTPPSFTTNASLPPSSERLSDDTSQSMPGVSTVIFFDARSSDTRRWNSAPESVVV